MPPDLPIRNHSLRILSELYAKGVAGFCSKDVPTDGINAAVEAVGDLALSLRTGMGQEIWPHPKPT